MCVYVFTFQSMVLNLLKCRKVIKSYDLIIFQTLIKSRIVDIRKI